MAPLGMRLALCALGMTAAQDLFMKDSAGGKFLAQQPTMTQPPPPRSPGNSSRSPGLGPSKPTQPPPPRPGRDHQANGTTLGAATSGFFGYWKTIGPSDGGGAFCLDLPGGDTTDGTLLWLWECAGQNNAVWVFDNYQIRYGLDETKCVDAGESRDGQILMLWECNGLPQQTWGWDESAARIYLSGQTKCLDWSDLDKTAGQSAFLWECNGGSDQYWSLWESPNPFGNPDIFPSDHCQYEVGNWPSFWTQQDLENDPWWSAYFINVYGAVPWTGYPICPGAFQFLWQTAATKAGVVDSAFTQCAPTDGRGAGQELADGTYYVGNSFLEARDVYGFIYNTKLLGAYAPANTWVEVTHTQFPGDKGVIWYYMSIGSGVYLYAGNTWVFNDHSDAVTDVLKKSCSDEKQDTFGPPNTECENDFEDLWKNARSQKVNTIQFTQHHDCTCGPTGTSSYKYNRQCMTEIVLLDDPNGGVSGCSSLLKGGWEATAGCNCQTSFTSTTKGGQLCDAALKKNNCQYANCGIF